MSNELRFINARSNKKVGKMNNKIEQIIEKWLEKFSFKVTIILKEITSNSVMKKRCQLSSYMGYLVRITIS